MKILSDPFAGFGSSEAERHRQNPGQRERLRGSSRGSANVRFMRRAEQLSKVADPFANPLRGGVMEVNDG